MAHLSLLCKLQQDRDHQSCRSGTCDGHGTGQPCGAACDCRCHPGISADVIEMRERYAAAAVVDGIEYGELTAEVSWPSGEITVLRADPRILIMHEVFGSLGYTRGAVTYKNGLLKIQAVNGHYVYRVGEEIPGRGVHPAEFPD